MKKAEGVTEQLKEGNQLEWIARMNNIEARAKEIVCNDMIYIVQGRDFLSLPLMLKNC